MKAINEIDKNKFNPELPCNLEPFAFIERTTKVKTEYGGEIAIISFGALDFDAHYAPEFGGVAMVHMDPDLLIAIKYLPWDKQLREEEHDRAVEFLKTNIDIEPNKITHTFHHQFGYCLPAKKEIQRRKYLQMRKDALLEDNEEYIRDLPNNDNDDDAGEVDGEELISLD